MDYQYLLTNFPELFRNNGYPLKIITDEQAIKNWQQKKGEETFSVGLAREWLQIGIVLDDPYILAIRDLVQFPDGRLNGYIRIVNQADLRGGQGAVILAKMNDKIALLHIFRHATRSWHYEIPRGFGEEGITAKKQAQIEIKEEINGEIANLFDLGILQGLMQYIG